jgi:hypothetical protein
MPSKAGLGYSWGIQSSRGGPWAGWKLHLGLLLEGATKPSSNKTMWPVTTLPVLETDFTAKDNRKIKTLVGNIIICRHCPQAQFLLKLDFFFNMSLKMLRSEGLSLNMILLCLWLLPLLFIVNYTKRSINKTSMQPSQNKINSLLVMTHLGIYNIAASPYKLLQVSLIASSHLPPYPGDHHR